MNNKPTRGMVLGKFMPPHLGHMFLFDFARHYVDELAIVVETIKGQPVPGQMRYDWVREMYPDAHVLHCTDENPQEPSEHPDFWQIWHDTLRRLLPFQPDYLFASEDYGWKLSEVLGCKFIPVDIDRSVMPVSGTKVRTDPFANWQYVPRIARPYFCKRVCIFGPESTGKSTLTRQLAEHFQTTFVPEYARVHLESRNGQIDASDIPLIARGQMAAEDAAAFNANKILFSDTDLISTTIWSDWLFKSCPQWIADEADSRQYDLYLVTDVDIPWVDDSVRYLPEDRKNFLDRCVSELEKRKRKYIVISGLYEDRLEKAIQSVEQLFAE